MVVCSMQRNGTRYLLLGLSTENVRRLEAGDPIRVSRTSHGLAVPEDLQIAIMVGDTETSILDDLKAEGLIGKATVVNQQRPL